MANLAVTAFLGMQPRRGARLLDDQMAVNAENTQGTSGYVTGRVTETLLTTLAPGAAPRRVFRLRSNTGAEKFLTFDTPDVDLVRAPQVNDLFERFYWAGDGILPSFNTFARIGSLPSFFLGVNPPATPPVLSLLAPGSGSGETRAYVYTYVDEFGQEGPPSPPTLITTNTDATVRVTCVAPPAVSGFATPTTIRIYRTVPGVSSSSYFFTNERPGATPVFDDNINSARVALNDLLQSLRWFPPPAAMKGMVAMPNGFLVGFKGRDLLFSEPYRPHAWPPQYTLSVEDDIVGLSVFDTTIAVLTAGTPFLASGVVPEAVSLVRVGPVNACVSRRSVVAMAGAALYASQDGIVALSNSGQNLLTEPLIDRDTWRTTYAAQAVIAARDADTKYVAFSSAGVGFEIDFSDIARGVVSIVPGLTPFGAFDQDATTRRALYTRGNQIYSFGATGPRAAFVWRSKEFFMTRPLNFGAAQVNYSTETVISGAPPITFVLFADSREVYRQPIYPGVPFKLPSGYKAQVYQFEVRGQGQVSRVMIAETERELEAV